MQALEKVPGIHLVNQVIKRKAKKTGGRSAPKGLSGWAKAQMMMIYAIEHDEMWCHKGFLQAGRQPKHEHCPLPLSGMPNVFASMQLRGMRHTALVISNILLANAGL